MTDHVTWQQHHGRRLLGRDGVDVIDCQHCGFIHIAPLPQPDELISFYRDAFYNEEKPDYLKNASEDREWLADTYNDRIDTFEAHLRPKRRKILDIGCGPGFFLATAAARGWQGLGIEPSPHAAAFARSHGVEVITDFFSRESAARIDKQDVVHMSQVLEHVLNPGELLSLAWDLLDTEGLICVSVPNDFNPLQRAFQAATSHQPWWVVPSHHINYFSFDSLEALLLSQGFTPIHREASFPLELFLLMGDSDYIDNPQLGRAVHGKRKRLERTLSQAGFNDTKRALLGAFAQAGIGRLAMVVARKQ